MKYRLNRSKRNEWLMWPFMYFIGIAANGNVLVSAWHKYGMSAPVFPAMLAFLVAIVGLSAWSYRNSSNVYEADEDGVVERTRRGERRIRWSDVVSIREGNSVWGNTITLADPSGSRIVIPISSLEHRGVALRELVESKLDGLRQAQTERFSSSPHTLIDTPVWLIYSLGGFGLLMLVIAGITALFAAKGPSWDVTVVLAGVGLAIFGLAATVGTKRCTFSGQEIVTGILWFEKHLPLALVESVFLYEIKTAGGPAVELMTIEGAGKRMQVSSMLSHFSELRAAVLSRVPPEAVKRGQRDKTKYERKYLKGTLIVLSIVSGLLVIFGALMAYAVAGKIQKFRTLERHGVAAMARVIGGEECNCSDRFLNVIDYEFAVNGKTYKGINSLSFGNVRVHKAETVEILYLPQDPHLNRIRGLMEWRGEVPGVVGMIALCLASPLIVPLYLRKIRWK